MRIISREEVEHGKYLERLRIRRGERVLIVGGYGTGNVGDEAILSGLLRLLPDGARVRVVSRSPSETEDLHQVCAISPAGAPRALLTANVLIVGGGGLFSGHMGPFGALIPYYAAAAALRGTRVAFHGVGVYPSTPSHVRWGLLRVAPRLSSFTVRDAISLETVRSWGVRAERVPDLSTLMAPGFVATGVHMLLDLGLDPARPTVGLCLTATDPSLEQSLLQEIPALVDAFPHVQFCFVPMSRHQTVPHHNDAIFGRKLRARAPRMVILESRHHPKDVLSLFQQFRAVIGMRYHSLLFAHRAGAAVLPVPYAEKCESWTQEQGIEPVALEPDALIKRLEAALGISAQAVRP